MPKILAFAGSLRRNSWNKKLIKVAAQGAREAGAEVTLLDMKDYPLPVYDGDDEKADGLPENAKKLKELFKAHDGLLISSPEYNSGYPGGLKNLIDWVSRPGEGEKPLEAFRGKPVAIMAASPGARGGMRMLPHLRDLLANIQMLVLPGMYGLAGAAEAFDEKGNLKDEKVAGIVKGLGKSVADMAARLA
ncbi:MAG: NAD(P)H-dependent oxidoreductase [Planctomycetes bacterium]|nr:NAD(P)H-dependent oxidoreductase [Planctomycetota bacterium]